MADRANVQSIDALKEAKAALAAFAEDVGAVLANVDSDVARMGQWVTMERPSHWKREIRRREDDANRARQEISRKILVSTPEPASTVLERKALARCVRRVEEAQKRAENSRRWAGTWDKQSLLARGALAALAEHIRADIPRAIARIDRMIESLQAYTLLAPPSSDLPETTAAVGAGAPAGGAGSMARPIAAPERWVDPEQVREIAADARERARPAGDEIAWDVWPLEPLHPDQGVDVLRLALIGQAPQGEQTLVIAAKALEQPTVVLERCEPSQLGDSGWYLGPHREPAATGACWRIAVARLLEARGDLAPLLALAPGALAVLGPVGVLAVLDRGGKDCWVASS